MKTYVWVKTDFAGFHRWKDAPPSVGFLANWHRHVFHVKAMVRVAHLNRELEFLAFKAELDAFIHETYGGDKNRFEDSCETIAAKIQERFRAAMVEVSEDGENGATVIYDPEPTAVTTYLFPESSWVTKPEIYDIGKLANARDRPFVGREAEGPHRGRLLLFVPGSTDPALAQLAVEKAGDVEGVYYGAGNDTAFRKDTFVVLTTFFPTPKITVECESVTKEVYDETEHTGVTLISRTPGDALADYVKTYHAGHAMLKDAKTGVVYATKLDDLLFSQDKYL